MKGTTLMRLYDTLTGEERFRLVLEARARDDRAEADRLERACPRRDYRMPEAEYAERRERIQTLTLAACLDLARPLAKLEVAAAFGWAAGVLRERALDGAESAADQLRAQAADAAAAELAEDWRGASAVLVGEALGPLERAAGALERDFAGEVRVIWDAFGRFCRSELQLEPAVVMGALLAPLVARLEGHRAALAAAEPDPAAVEAYARALTDGWRRAVD